MRIYLDMPIETALQSKDPFVRSLGIVDQRVGARTLKAISVDESDHPVVKAFYQLRVSNQPTVTG